ncbi:MAG TPA: hypothetical protein PL187_18500 [Caldilinea sp.]|nr:hypothetical protein [Anaerolineales bacterium]HRA68028.1 hypothetical protein [Caldilinea sp.]
MTRADNGCNEEAYLFHSSCVIPFDAGIPHPIIFRSALLITSPPSEPIRQRAGGNVDNQGNQTGYSGLFYVMLILGIIGVIGLLLVAGGAAGGGM